VAAERPDEANLGAIKRKTLQVSLVAISTVFVFEFAAGIATNSLALLTDGAHALLDAVVTLVLIIATTLALKPRDTDHTYGHGKIETIGGFIGGAALFVVAIFFIYEAAARIVVGSQTTPMVNPGAIAFVAVIYTLAVDVFRIAILSRAAVRTAAQTIRADLYHSIADLASTGVALLGLWLVTAGFIHGDSIAAILLGGVLAYLSVRFTYRNAKELTDIISPRLVSIARGAAGDTEGVLECRDVRMHRVGTETFVDVTVALRSEMSFENAHKTSAKVEANIARDLTEAGLYIAPSNVTVHFEPGSTGSAPAESIIEKAAADVNGVRGVHNILVTRIGGTDLIGVSLHVQVNGSATLSEAHSVSDAVEESIRRQLKGVENITVHLEPRIPELGGVRPLSDPTIQDSIRRIIRKTADVREAAYVAAYKTEDGILKIDIRCTFKPDSRKEMTIEQIHDRVSEIEKQIRSKYPRSVVTIHAEPS
jgi:cation diffusion facilitator family transporter